jgi:hypothetical protein
LISSGFLINQCALPFFPVILRLTTQPSSSSAALLIFALLFIKRAASALKRHALNMPVAIGIHDGA